jgi:hypothetical protein
MTRRVFRLTVDYGQFHLDDSTNPMASAEVWTGTALEYHLGAVSGFVAFGAAKQSGETEVEIVIEPHEPQSLIEEADHIAEVSVVFSARTLRLSECLEQEGVGSVQLPQTGTWRCRMSALHLDRCETDADRYMVQLWLADGAPPQVLRWYEPWKPRTDLENPHGLRVITGAAAWDERLKMTPAGMRQDSPNESPRFLFQDATGAYWEYGGEHGTDLIEIPPSEVGRYDKKML